MISLMIFGEAMRATPPSARICAGTRSRAMTATAPAFSAISACSAFDDVHDDAALQHLGQADLQAQSVVVASWSFVALFCVILPCCSLLATPSFRGNTEFISFVDYAFIALKGSRCLYSPK